MPEIVMGVRVHLGNGRFLAYREDHQPQGTGMYENRWVRKPESGPTDRMTVDQILQRWLGSGLITAISDHNDPQGNPPGGGRTIN